MLSSLLGRKSSEGNAQPEATSEPTLSVPQSFTIVEQPNFIDLKVRLHQQLIDVLNLAVIERMPRDQFEREVGDIIRDMLKRETGVNVVDHERKRIVAEVLDELLGLGPLEPLLKDEIGRAHV